MEDEPYVNVIPFLSDPIFRYTLSSLGSEYPCFATYQDHPICRSCLVRAVCYIQMVPLQDLPEFLVHPQDDLRDAARFRLACIRCVKE